MLSANKAIADAVFRNRSSHSPFLIVGSVGTGKSCILKELNTRIATGTMLSCEQLISRFINAIQQGDLTSFRNTLHETDALLIDDIQTLSCKIHTQTEMVNLLKAFGKPVILTIQSGSFSFSAELTAYLDSCTTIHLPNATTPIIAELFHKYRSAYSITLSSNEEAAIHTLISSGFFQNYYQLEGFVKTLSLHRLTEVEPFTDSLIAFMRTGLRSFL